NKLTVDLSKYSTLIADYRLPSRFDQIQSTSPATDIMLPWHNKMELFVTGSTGTSLPDSLLVKGKVMVESLLDTSGWSQAAGTVQWSVVGDEAKKHFDFIPGTSTL